MARILVTCFGSYGDLYPYIALAKSLQQRGHDVAIGSTAIYQAQLEAEGVPFIHLRSNLDRYTTPEAVREFLRRIFDPVKGGEHIAREMMTRIEETYVDTLDAVIGVDLVISHPLAYATPLVCQKQNIPWLSTILAPMFFLSVYDPPIISAAPWLRTLHRLSPALYRGLFKLLKWTTKPWIKPLYQLCARHQLPVPSAHPLFEGQYSPYGTLAMFSRCFAEPQADWPVKTTITGFPLFSGEMAENAALRNLQTFLDGGDAPLVFALGSSAVNVADDFYVVSAAIARKLKRRAVLVCGSHNDQVKAIEPGDDLFVIQYVAYEKLFPHACLIVHQGGIGTLAQSLRAQRPILVVPFGFDQFDNGERSEKLGVGKYLPRKDYNIARATPIIEALLMQPIYTKRAQEIGKLIQFEDGMANMCDVVERVLADTAKQK